MRIAISAESTNDLPKELLEKFDVKVIPYQIVTKDSTFNDGEVSVEELFKIVSETNTLPKTNAINEYEYTEYFKEIRKEYDAVIHICLSSGLSSSCSNAERAAKNVKDVYVVDSLSLSAGIGLLVVYARQLAEQGVAPAKIAEMVSARTEKLQTSFVIERLDYLYKGGRCNSLQLLGANLLKLRPRIVLRGGKMSSDRKYRGTMEKVVAKYCEETLTEYNTPDLEYAFIPYTTASEQMLKAAKTALENAGFKNIYEAHAGCTIASHCGANTLGIIYFNDGEPI